MPELVDDREEQATLDVGRASLETQDREPKIAGSARFADDSEPPADPGEQSIVSTEGDERQRTLNGGTAATVPEWKQED